MPIKYFLAVLFFIAVASFSLAQEQSTCPFEVKRDKCAREGLNACYIGGTGCICSREACPTNVFLWNQPKLSQPIPLIQPDRPREAPSQEGAGVRAGDQPSRSSCRKTVDDCVNRLQRRDWLTCLMRGGKKRRPLILNLVDAFRWRDCIFKNINKANLPKPQSCDLEKECTPPRDKTLDDWLEGLSHNMNCICTEVLKVKSKEKQKPPTACTMSELEQIFKEKNPQCRPKGN